MSDMAGNPNCWVSNAKAHMVLINNNVEYQGISNSV